MLDIGAQGVMIPQVTTEAEAEAAVQSAKYHPRGRRGLAGSRATDYGLRESQEASIERANAETMVVALIEDVTAIANLDAIMGVDGIDVLFIGAADLAQSMGHPGHPDHADVRAAIDRIIDQGVAANRVVGINAATSAAAAHYAERGVRFFALSPWHPLAAAWRDYLAAIPGRQSGRR